jgi:CRP-like cAMP-binding protein
MTMETTDKVELHGRAAPGPNSFTALRLFLDRLLARSTLSQGAQDIILNLPGEIAEIQRNEDFLDIGATANHAHLVTAGLTARWGRTSDGPRQITALHVPGDMPDLHSLLLSDVAFGLQALSTAIVLQVPHAALRQAANNPEIAEAFWRDGTADMAIASEWVVNIGRRNAKTRIAHLICEIATRLGVNGGQNEFVFHFPITQNQIADATGLSSVHVNRSVQDLKKAGLAVLKGAQVHVLDWRRLQSGADFDPAYLHFGKKA